MGVTVSPAYGRDYKSKDEAIKDFKDGKDFMCEAVEGMPVGRYCSIRDFPYGTVVSIRYGKLRKQAIITINKEEEL